MNYTNHETKVGEYYSVKNHNEEIIILVTEKRDIDKQTYPKGKALYNGIYENNITLSVDREFISATFEQIQLLNRVIGNSNKMQIPIMKDEIINNYKLY